MVLVLGILEYFPIAIVFAVGIFMAIGHRKRHPRVSLLAGISFSMMFLIYVFWRSPHFYIITEEIIEPHMCVYINYAVNFLTTAICILIIISIFGWRERDNTQGGLESGPLPTPRRGDES